MRKFSGKIFTEDYNTVITVLKEIDRTLPNYFADGLDTGYNPVLDQLGIQKMGEYTLNLTLRDETWSRLKSEAEKERSLLEEDRELFPELTGKIRAYTYFLDFLGEFKEVKE